MELLEFTRQHITLSAELEDLLSQAFRKEELSKGHQLLLPGNSSTKVFFIERGLARTFYIKEEKDITHHFFTEDSFVMPIESIFYNTPSSYGIELLEKSVVRIASYPAIEKYIEQSPALEKLIRVLLIDVLKDFSDRLYALQFQSAQQRYASMLANYPDILLRAPLGHIASYLGITPQTLSVIRAQK